MKEDKSVFYWNTLRVNGCRYVRVSDVVAAVIRFSEAEEFDTRRRLEEWVRNIRDAAEAMDLNDGVE